MRWLSRLFTILTVLALQHFAPQSLGQDDAEKLRTETANSEKLTSTESDAPPVNFLDLSFDVESVQKAISEGDASSIADAGLQLRESERVLLRSHPAIKSSEVLQLAVRKAVATGDSATLDRLDLLAKQHDLTDLAHQIAVARKLGSNARADEPQLSLDAQSTTVHQFDAIMEFRKRLDHAALIGDRITILELESQLKDMSNLQLQDYLQQAIKAAKASIPVDHPKPSAFLRLSGESRGWGVKDLDPFNKNSGSGKTLKKADDIRLKKTDGVMGGRYEVTIRNPTKGPVFYTFNGEVQIGLLAHQKRTHRGTGKPEIEFSSGYDGGVRSYRLDSGRTYQFGWKSYKALDWQPAGNALDLYKD
jgi:hypothetical protein